MYAEKNDSCVGMGYTHSPECAELEEFVKVTTVDGTVWFVPTETDESRAVPKGSCGAPEKQRVTVAATLPLALLLAIAAALMPAHARHSPGPARPVVHLLPMPTTPPPTPYRVALTARAQEERMPPAGSSLPPLLALALCVCISCHVGESAGSPAVEQAPGRAVVRDAVPRSCPGVTARRVAVAPKGPATVAMSTLIDLNSAGASELATLPGVGRSRAAAILEHREIHGRFARIDDVAAVKGVGARTVGKLRGLVRCGVGRGG